MVAQVIEKTSGMGRIAAQFGSLRIIEILSSGYSIRKDVEVRVLSRAPPDDQQAGRNPSLICLVGEPVFRPFFPDSLRTLSIIGELRSILTVDGPCGGDRGVRPI